MAYAHITGKSETKKTVAGSRPRKSVQDTDTLPVRKRRRLAKWQIALIIVLGVIVLGFVAVRLFLSKQKSSTAAAQTYRVRQETNENIIEISGNILAAQSQTLRVAGAGTVTKVNAKEGDFVKKGQVLLELDAVEQNYELANLDYQIAQTKINGSKKELELQQQKRTVLQKKLEDRKVVASFDGYLAQFSVLTGDYLEAKDVVGTLIDRSYMKASVEVVETDVSKLKVNQPVRFTFPAYSKPVTGYVVSYPTVGSITSRGATVVETELRIDNPPEEILPQFSFTGVIQITEPETVLVVERQAVSSKGGKSYAEVVQRDGTTKEVQVTVESYGTKYVKILSGLSAGDVVQSTDSTQSGWAASSGSGGNAGFGGNSGFGGMTVRMGR